MEETNSVFNTALAEIELTQKEAGQLGLEPTVGNFGKLSPVVCFSAPLTQQPCSWALGEFAVG